MRSTEKDPILTEFHVAGYGGAPSPQSGVPVKASA